MIAYLKSKGFRRFEGMSSRAEYIEEQNLIREVGARVICQTGMNAGVSALAFLCAAPNTRVHSFDLGDHPYVRHAQDYILREFGDRHSLVLGNSAETLKAAAEQQNIICDVAFVDGGHSYDVAISDMTFFKKFTIPGGRVIVDDCVTKDSVHGNAKFFLGMEDVNRAYQFARDTSILKHVRTIV